MGVTLSTPNFWPRADQLLFSPEILEKVLEHMTPRDLCIARRVCRGWMEHVSENSQVFPNNFGVVCSGSEFVLHELAKAPSTIPLTFSTFFLENVDLTPRPQSLNFWKLYSDMITTLDLSDCTIMFRQVSESLQHDGENQTVQLGCSNLKQLSLKRMDKYFMLGGQYIQLHQLIPLRNLETLDVSHNNYLSDKILFDILTRTEKLKSINLSHCPVVFIRAVHHRFYPQDDIKPSDNILSFEKLVKDFLRRDHSQMRELKLGHTKINSHAVDLICDPVVFRWESLDLSYCRELKYKDFEKLISSHCANLRELILNTDNSTFNEVPLCQFKMPNLELLEVAQVPGFATVEYVKDMPKLKVFNCTNNRCLDEPKIVPTFKILTNVTNLNISEGQNWVNNKLMQTVIKIMRNLKRLNISKCPFITDSGISGIQIDLFGEEIDLRFSQTHPDLPDEYGHSGHCLSELEFLQEVNLSNNYNLGAGTWYRGLRLRNLSRLDLSRCERVTANSLHAICSNCPSLEYLNIVRCNNPVSQNQEVHKTVQKCLTRLRHFAF